MVASIAMLYHIPPMHRFWDTILRPALELIDAKRLVEVGVGGGENTRKMLDYCREKKAVLHAVDPSPDIDMSILMDSYGTHLAYHPESSLSALPLLEEIDVIFIDGDHNWYTVHTELEIVERKAQKNGHFPLIFLHDTAWPYGRRDLYYDPSTIPPHYRQAHKQGGIIPVQSALLEADGFNPQFHHALYEHNPRNGVLTAVEDFLRETQRSLSFVSVPGYHGLGVLCPQTLLRDKKSFARFFRSLALRPPFSEHVARLERDRVDCLIHIGRLRKDTDAQDQLIHAQEREKAKLLEASEREQRHLHAMMAEKEDKWNRNLETLVERHEHVSRQLQKDNVEKEEKHIRDMQSLMETHERQEKEMQRTMKEKEERHAQEMQSALAQHKLANAAELAHVLHTRSWRWTKPVRVLEARLRRALGRRHTAVSSDLRTIPIALPSVAQTVERPSAPTPAPVISGADPSWTAAHPSTVAVIIPCHNYGRYLAEAIESVLAQTEPPQEIVVVDDSSTDDTRTVADTFSHKGVRYIRGDWHGVGAARNAGLDATTADLLVFLDADDLLHPDYLRCSRVALASNRRAAVAYSDQQYFGEKKMTFHAPPVFDWLRFDTMNHFSVSAMVRRDALVQAGGWSHGVGHDGDWVTWRRILALGWEAVKSNALFFYRMHGTNMHKDLEKERTHAQRTGFSEEPVTLCISLSGRAWAWPLTRKFLEEQTLPHATVHLIVLDTSQNEAFGREVKEWLAHCDYASHAYLRAAVGMEGLADLPREEHAAQVDRACAGIYNRFARLAHTPVVCFLEDDVIPPDDAYVRLIASFTPESVSVSGVYFKRDHPDEPVTWEWSDAGHPVQGVRKTGVAPVGGNGFGCIAVRGDVLRRTVFRRGPLSYCFDHNFYKDLVQEQGRTALVDWNCVCRHYRSATQWS